MASIYICWFNYHFAYWTHQRNWQKLIHVDAQNCFSEEYFMFIEQFGWQLISACCHSLLSYDLNYHIGDNFIFWNAVWALKDETSFFINPWIMCFQSLKYWVHIVQSLEMLRLFLLWLYHLQLKLSCWNKYNWRKKAHIKYFY